MNVSKIHSKDVQKSLEDAQPCTIVDVREHVEYANERVKDSVNIALSCFDEHAQNLDKNHQYYILCKSGNRARQAATQMKELGFDHVHVIEGGMDAWKNHGFETEQSTTKVWGLERQVRFTAGMLVTLGLVIGFFIHPGGYFFSGLIGLGLMFSAITNTCGMGMVLAKMPWNQAPKEK